MYMSSFRGGSAIIRGQTMRAPRETLWMRRAWDSASRVGEGGLVGVGVVIVWEIT